MANQGEDESGRAQSTNDLIDTASDEIRTICNQSGSGSKVYEQDTPGYAESIGHYLASSSEFAQIAVQPGSADDLKRIMDVLSKYAVPFSVKGGGHAMIPKHSSTKGILISMALFKQVEYNENTKNVVVGAGCLWEDVADNPKMKTYKRCVVGGATGVGVAGWMLGGGYSLKTNQYGLGIDNVVEFEVVTPMAQIRKAVMGTDLFNALRGGGSNFGIVTKFTLLTHHQGAIWILRPPPYIPGSKEEKAIDAIADFCEHERHKEAALVAAFRHTLVGNDVEYNISALCVWDGDNPPQDIFRRIQELLEGSDSDSDGDNDSGGGNDGRFRQVPLSEVGAGHALLYLPLAAPHGTDAIHAFNEKFKNGTLKAGDEMNVRGRFGCIMVSHYTKTLIQAAADEAKNAAVHIKARNGRLVLVDVWPFLPSIFDQRIPDAAWPHEPGKPYGPCLAYFLWEKEEDDEFWLEQMATVLVNLWKVAAAEGCTKFDAPVYNNTSLEITSVESIYQDNLKKLERIRKEYDPIKVMSVAGRFRIR